MIDRHRPPADDEALSALLDGALPNEEAERLRQRLSREPSLAERFAALERANAAVRDAYADVAAEPLPAQVLELLSSQRSAGNEDGDRARNVIELAAHKQRSKPRFVTIPAAIAASIALAIGLSLGVWFGPRAPAPESAALIATAGSVEPGTELHDVLQTVRSGATRALGGNLAATPRLTFKTLAGDYCRHVDLTSARNTTATLACRRSGGWQLEVLHFGPPGSRGPEGLYRPATGTPSTLDSAIDELIDGAPLDAQAEDALIAGGWTDAAE
jgi:anti-sigma factor RsiW